MIALPSWFSRPAPKGKQPASPPTSATLTQLLAEADADVAEAEAREAAAAEREAAERTPGAVEAYEAVRVEADRLRRFRDRLRADLEAAEAREAEELRQRQVARVEEIRGLVSHAAVRAAAADLVAREVDLRIALVEVRLEREAQRHGLGRLVVEGQVMAERLGLARLEDHTSVADSPVPVAEALYARLATMDSSAPAWRMLREIAYELSPHTRGS